MESLKYPRQEELAEPELWATLTEPKDLSTQLIVDILRGKEPVSWHDIRDLREELLRRNVTLPTDMDPPTAIWPLLALAIVIFIIAFFGWKLFKSLKDKEKKREEKKKLKQKKKK